jgi:hypothetical protein
VGDHSVAPHPHQRLFIKSNARNPLARRLLKAPSSDKYVKVGIEFQISPKSMGDNDNPHADTISISCPLLNHTGPKGRQIVQEMPISFENGPEFPWHRKDDA